MRAERVVRLVFGVATLCGLAVFGIGAFRMLLWSMWNEPFWVDLIKRQVPAMIGLPLAAIAAMGLVLVVRTTSGPIEFDVIGVKAKGAAGPLLMWVLCFGVMVAAIKLVWLP